jgi:hypothetical protein
VRLEDRARLGIPDVRVLDPRIGQRRDDAAVERRVGRLVDDGPRVEGLEVDGVDGPGGREVGWSGRA